MWRSKLGDLSPSRESRSRRAALARLTPSRPNLGVQPSSIELSCHITPGEACSARRIFMRSLAKAYEPAHVYIDSTGHAVIMWNSELSRIEKPKVVKGDRLACYRTLVNLILSILAIGDRVEFVSPKTELDQSLPRASRSDNSSPVTNTFDYEGLTMMDRSMIDTPSGGALMDKTPTVARHLIFNMTSNT
ncbi:hypothetical protein CR513_54929, partial [Mucuna pruriens]